MAYCKNCGNLLTDGATFCTSCGTSQGTPAVKDEGGFGWGLLCCCIPIVGLILSGILMYVILFVIGFLGAYYAY